MRSQPTGTVTFLFTDVVGSTAAWEADPAGMAEALAVHDRCLKEAIAEHGGHVFATGGDGYAVAFQRAGDAVTAGAHAQRALRAAPWPAAALAVRMGAHTGETVERDGDYFGPSVNRAARVMGAAHGGQLVVTSVTAALVPALPDGVTARPAGSHRFKGVEEAIEVVELVVDGVDDLGPLRRAHGETHHLPEPRTSFVGRIDELRRLRTAVDDHRLVSVVAPGGSGKTRLVTQLADELAARRRDGVWFVDLADVRRDDAVRAAVGAALDLGAREGHADRFAALSTWDAVLVLDNCEQVIDGAAETAEALLDAGPGVSVLTTSREALAIDGEQVVALGPLAASDEAGDEAVGLFLARARLVAPDLRPNPDELAQIAALCDAVDRLPLAIELAAARVDRLAIEDLAEALLDGSTDRRARRRGGRHRDLRSVLAWSTELLDDEERAVWRRLSVFDGGFTTDAAVEVAGDGAARSRLTNVIDGLVDRSLVVRSRTPFGMRHHLLETMRAVALEELADADEIQAIADRHAAWVRSWTAAGQAVPARSWTRDDTEIDNQRAALHHLLERNELEAAAVLLGDAASALGIGGHLDEVRVLLTRLRTAVHDAEASARLDVAELTMLEWGGELVASHTLADRVRAADADDRSWGLASALQAHHLAALDPAAAASLLDEMEERLGPLPLIGFLRAEAALTTGRHDEAVAHQLAAWGVETIADLPRPRPHQPVDITMLSDLGLALLGAGRLDEIAHVLAAMADAHPPPALRFYLPMHRALWAGRRGRPTEGVRHLTEAAHLERRWPSPIGATDLGVAAADLAAAAGERELAVEAVAAARAAGQRTVGCYGWGRSLTRRLRDEMSEEIFVAARARGSELAPRVTVDRILDRLAA